MAAETTADPAEPLLDDVAVDLSDPASILDVLARATEALAAGFVARLPLILLALVLLLLGLVAVRVVAGWTRRGLARSRMDRSVAHLILNLVRIGLALFVVLFALSVAGVRVGTALAGLGLAGLALAFALQNILENFVAGILILIRAPVPGRRPDRAPTTTPAWSRRSTCASPACA